MNKKWFRLLLFLPIILFFVSVNYLLDYQGCFHDVNKETALSILDGNNTAFFNSLDEREVKHQIIKYMPDEVDCIVIGPSLAMCIGNDIVCSKSLYNLGVSGGVIYDYLAQFGLLEINNKKINRVILCLDSQTFDKTIYKDRSRSYKLMPFANYMIDTLNKVENRKEIRDNLVPEKKFTNIFSITCFQENIERFFITKSRNRVICVDDNYEGAFYSGDASFNYTLEYRNHTIKDVIEDVKNYNFDNNFTPGEHIDEYASDIFEKLISYLKDKKVEVELYLCPLAPSLWDKYDNEKYPIILELSDYALKLSNKYNLKITGSYNPYELGITDGEFIDARHIQRENLYKYFNFK